MRKREDNILPVSATKGCDADDGREMNPSTASGPPPFNKGGRICATLKWVQTYVISGFFLYVHTVKFVETNAPLIKGERAAKRRGDF